jgi:serine/threonine protein kinase
MIDGCDAMTHEDPTRIVTANAAFGWLRPAEAADEIGRLAHYRVLKALGRGGMGIVFEAEDVQLGRRVALKVIRPDVAADDEVRGRFLREARAAAALKNDHVVTIYQVGEDAGVMFLAMELLRGRSLDSWLKPDRRATVAEVLILGKQIARGLSAAHAAGLVHRDIKPANLWLEAPKARLKILDFGLARIADGSAERLTGDGALLGTPSYMPPEHLRGEEVDHRGDLFSFGCVLYRMATGALPFTGDSISAVLHAITARDPVPVGQVNPNVPARLSDVIGRMLAKSPAERPESAQAVLDELQDIEREWKQQGADNLPAGETTVDSSVGNASRRSPRWWIGAGLAAVAVLVGVWMVSGRAGGPAAPVDDIPAVAIGAPVVAQPVRIDLLTLIDVERDRVRGRWRREEDGHVIGETPGREPSICLLAIPWSPPTDYRLHVDVKRLTPAAGHCAIGLATGEHRFAMVIDHPIGESRRMGSGVLIIDGQPIDKRVPGRFDRVLPVGKTVAIACTVHRDRVSVSANDEVIFEWQGDLNRLQRKTGGIAVKLFLGASHNSAFEFENVVLEPLGDDPGRAI